MKATPGAFGPFRYAMSSEDRATEPMMKKNLDVAHPGWDYYFLFLLLCLENLAMSGARSLDIVTISTCYLFWDVVEAVSMLDNLVSFANQCRKPLRCDVP
jgi:hypothetical protein